MFIFCRHIDTAKVRVYNSFLVMTMLKIVLIIVLAIVILITAGLTWAFCTAFVRRKKKPKKDAITDSITAHLKVYEEDIKNGLAYAEALNPEQVFTRSYDGLKLAARLYGGEFKSTIITFHGYRSPAKRDYSCAIRMYREMGLNVLLIDHRSHGDSEGKLITYGIKERFDAAKWVDYLINRFGSDHEIFFSGISMGAATVMMASDIGLPQNVKGIVADSGYSSPSDIIGKVAEDTFGISRKIAMGILEPMCRIFGGFSLYETSALKALENNTIPMLFIHGKADSLVPYEMSVKCYEIAKCKKDIVLVDGAEHGCGYMEDKESLEKKLKEFFDMCREQ